MTLKETIKAARARARTKADVCPQPERNYWLGVMSGLSRRQNRKNLPKKWDPFGPVLQAMFDRGVWDGYQTGNPNPIRFGPQMRLTVKEFVEFYGEALERNNEAYMRFCCQGYVLKNGHKCQMPEGWNAEKMGSTWVITPDPEAFADKTPA
ncbi:MAG: hypothetical protein V3U60_16100 [Gammaproteobacteria bacterium]